MKSWLALAKGIDGWTDRIGRVSYWLTLLMVLIGACNALLRTLSKFIGTNLSSNAMIELQWYLFSAVFLLGAAYTLRHGGHVRVDVLYSRLSPRTQAWINVVGTLLFLVPFCLLMIWVAYPSVMDSWSRWEASPDPGGLPRYPIKTLVPLAFAFLLIQGFAELLKSLAIALGVRSSNNEAEPGAVS